MPVLGEVKPSIVESVREHGRDQRFQTANCTRHHAFCAAAAEPRNHVEDNKTADFMSVLYESVENIEAVFPRSKERIAYRGLLQVLKAGASPVRLELTFVPPHPFCFNMPESHSIRSKSVMEVYVKLTKFLRRSGFAFGC